MSWFKRTAKGIQTSTEEKKDIPKGLWFKSPSGNIVEQDELVTNFYVSPDDDYHVRIGSKEYFQILFDNNEFKELDANMVSKDPLSFVDTKSYDKRFRRSQLNKNGDSKMPFVQRWATLRGRLLSLAVWISLSLAALWVV